ncbi:hypothetical protein AYI69_g9219 [Smittium culicis]|uniref:Uncharacterized protein n=1 Tax=Smittium culicis TaxID=133412 RepID=A0A1R1XE35_9FUNG|nr:hypothetical protein AYI69_g9219 [Smittium culicis]
MHQGRFCLSTEFLGSHKKLPSSSTKLVWNALRLRIDGPKKKRSLSMTTSRGPPIDVLVSLEKTDGQQVGPQHLRERVPDFILEEVTECEALVDFTSKPPRKSLQTGPLKLKIHPYRYRKKIDPVTQAINAEEVASLLSKNEIEQFKARISGF